jgi:hypothetical protein
VNGFIDHLYTQLGTTLNYSATANLNDSQITTAPAKAFPACCIFTSRSLTTASSSGDSSVLRAQVLLSQPPVQNSTQLTELWRHFFSASLLQSSTGLDAPVLFFISPRRGPRREHPISNSKSIVACVFVSAGTCLPSRCSETAVCLFVYCIATAVHPRIF